MLPNYTPRPQQMRDATITFKRSLDSCITTATIIQAAWAILVSAYSGSDAALFGLTLSGRDASVDMISEIVGPTLTPVPMRVQLDRDMTLDVFLHNIQNANADIRKYQHTGLQHIRRLGAEASAAADFQNLLIVHGMGDGEITAPLQDLGLQVIKSRAEETMDIPLTLECTILEDSLYIAICFDSRVVEGRQVDVMLRQFQHIFSTFTDKSQIKGKLGDLVLVSPYELEKLREWNKNMPPFANETLHGLVEGQVALTPNSIATTGFDGEYTYQELDLIANRLAAHLTALGVGVEDNVVLSFKKSTWPIIAMLAVLKSGGVCVSLNFEHPLDRRLELIRDVEPVVVLCDAEQEEQYHGHNSKMLVVDDALFTRLPATVPSDLVRPKVQPTNAAFIIYTSGSSTGKPKGCVFEHHAACLSQRINTDTMNITSTTRALQFAAYTWDPSILEIFGPLIRGGSVCIISDEERMNSLAATIEARKVTWTWQTPTVAKLINPKEVPSLDTLVFCGEPLTQNVLRPWSEAGLAKLINFYSAAETSNIGTINLNHAKSPELISIGRANGCGVWIVERGNCDRLVPIGAIGEVLIEGYALIRGYWKMQEENQAVFLEDPLWSRGDDGRQQHRRFYKTGDIGFFDLSGNVQLLGRADRQAKLNGMRVDLHEIEYQIRQQLPSDTQVTVEVVPWTPAKLTAFIKLPAFTTSSEDRMLVASADQVEIFRAAVKDLHESLSVKIPRHMIPSAFIPVANMPLLATTKTDRRSLISFAQSLPKEGIFGVELSTVKEAPNNITEASLQLVWSQILKQDLSQIGVNDSFLALGGDSITAMQAVSECRRVGIKLKVSEIIEKLTIVDIALQCESIPVPSLDSASISGKALQLAKKARCPSIAMEDVRESFSTRDVELGFGAQSSFVHGIYPCTPMQEGILLSQQMDSEIYHIECVWEFNDDYVSTDGITSRLRRAWESLVDRHPTMRTGILEHSTQFGHFVQVVLNTHPTTTFSQWSSPIENSSKIASIREPKEEGLCTYLPRLMLYSTANGKRACRMTINHAFTDGMSVDILMEELISLLLGESLSVPPMEFLDYVEYEQATKSKESMQYWSSRLKDMKPCYIPTIDHEEVGSPVQDVGFIQIPKSVTKGLASFCRKTSITQAAFLQAAWAIVLGAFTGQNDVAFGSIASVRDVPLDGIETCVGPLICIQVCRVQASGTVGELLQHVHRDNVAGLQHRDRSLADIQNALGRKKGPLFNTSMTVRRALDDAEQSKMDKMIKLINGPAKTEVRMSIPRIPDLY